MTKVKTMVKELFEDKEDVTFFPTYGFRHGAGWKIPLRIWVHEPRRFVEKLTSVLIDSWAVASEHEIRNFKSRISNIVADSESFEQVVFVFENDPEQQRWTVHSNQGGQSTSDMNGIIDGYIELSEERAKTIQEAQATRDGWLTIRAISREHSGLGRIRLIPPKGVSVVSDIDDTLKITEIPAGGKIVVRNTFFADFIAAPEMLNWFKSLHDACFHYVSGAPWQLYIPLSTFIRKTELPEGSFHMKNVPTNLLSPKTWRDLLKLAGDATIEQKYSQISMIMGRFPGRQFVLVGDSGEHDPEIYRKLWDQFGNQVKDIWIRDVVRARYTNPKRLEGMKVIPARTVLAGVTAL